MGGLVNVKQKDAAENLPIPPVVCCLMTISIFGHNKYLLIITPPRVKSRFVRPLGLTHLLLLYLTALCGVLEVCAAANGGAVFLLAFGLFLLYPIGVDASQTLNMSIGTYRTLLELGERPGTG